MEEAVRKWMINPKTPKTAPASTGRRGIMGDIEWVIVGGIISRMLCITWRGEGKGLAPPEDP